MALQAGQPATSSGAAGRGDPAHRRGRDAADPERRGNLDLTSPSTWTSCARKTAACSPAAARRPGSSAGTTPSSRTRCGTTGCNIGMAFQIVDDLLDFTGDEDALGKPVGGDLREGKMTLPVIHLLPAGRRGRGARPTHRRRARGDARGVARAARAAGCRRDRSTTRSASPSTSSSAPRRRCTRSRRRMPRRFDVPPDYVISRDR